MRRYLLCGCLLMAGSAFCQKNLVRSADGEFQIQLPATWFRLNSSTAEFQRYAPENNFSSTEINVQIRPRPDDIKTIEELAAANETLVKSQFGDMLKINVSTYEIIDGRKWWKMEAAINVPGTTGYNLWLQATLGTNQTYLVSFAALADDFAKYKPLMESALASAQFTGAPITEGSTANLAVDPVNSGQVAGSIAPGAMKLDVDEMRLFFGKYTVMKKGDQEALYDDNMKEIVPFGKFTYPPIEAFVASDVETSYSGTRHYRRITPSWYGTNGIFNANAKPTKLMGFYERSKNGQVGRTGFIDQNGKAVFEHPAGYDAEGYQVSVANNVMVSKKFDGTVITGKANTLRAFTEWPGASTGYYGWSGGLLATRASAMATEYPEGSRSIEEGNKRVGYINRKGEFQVKPAYYKVAEFSEGVAFVCRKDETGVEKWGAIDTTGNIIIPFQYKHQPGRFSNGRSLIKAVDMPGVAYGMINKKGQIVFTLPYNYNDSMINLEDAYAPPINPGPERFLFSYGYTFIMISTKQGRENGERDNLFLLDTNGHYTPIMQLLRRNFPNGETITIMSRIQHNQFLFKVSSNVKEGIGIADVKGNILIAPVFSKLALFEPESKLQYAEVDKFTLVDKQDPNKGIEGYIDRQGVFQVVRNLRKSSF